jgi:hypothetical protein
MGFPLPVPGALKLEIDGQEFPLAGIWYHPQSDPYPGGHEYHLRVSTDLAKEWMVPPNLTKTGQIDEQSQRSGLAWFYDLFIPFRMKGFVTFSHVLNTITKVKVSDAYLDFCGVCSPFIRKSNDKAESS